MQWLNYHHLLYFWTAARLGGISAASKSLNLTHPTVSSQIKELEHALGEKLFARKGRGLELTQVGRMVFRYADEIFSLGQELVETLKGRPTGHPVRLRVGITEVVPKLVALELLKPAFQLTEPVKLICVEDHHQPLLASLALHELDVVISDVPTTAADGVRAFNHVLGESGLSFFASAELRNRLDEGFPQCLDGQPFIMPTPNTTLHGSLHQWFGRLQIAPQVVAEVEDAALIKVLGQSGLGAFALPSVIEGPLSTQYNLSVLGKTDEVKERFYAITMKRTLRHPGVVAISEAARSRLFSRAVP